MTHEYDSDAQDEHSVELSRGSSWPRSRRRSVATAGVAACLAAATALLVLAGVRQESAGARLGPDELSYDSDGAQLALAPIASDSARLIAAGSVEQRSLPMPAASALSSSSPAPPAASATLRARPQIARNWRPQALPQARRTRSRVVDDEPPRSDAPVPAESDDTGFAPGVGDATSSGSSPNPALPHTDTVNPALPNNSSGSGSSSNPALPHNSGSSSDFSPTPELP